MLPKHLRLGLTENSADALLARQMAMPCSVGYMILVLLVQQLTCRSTQLDSISSRKASSSCTWASRTWKGKGSSNTVVAPQLRVFLILPLELTHLPLVP